MHGASSDIKAGSGSPMKAPERSRSSTEPARDATDLGEGITGVAVNDSTAMQISNDTTCGPANLIFASVHGKLIGVNTDLSTTGGFVPVSYTHLTLPTSDL